MKNKNLKVNELKCPCCQSVVEDQDMQQTLGREVESWGGLISIKRAYLERGFYQWSCDACLKKGRAIRGDFRNQVFCDYNPHLAYYDIPKQCDTCLKGYVFKAKEQQYWYEDLKFWVQSEPKHCPSCRKIRREERALNKELSELLREKSDLSLKTLQRLAEIYEEIGKPERAKYFQSRVKKLKA